MTELNNLDVCRLCLSRTGRMAELTKHITHIISTCFSLKIHISSQLPNKICQVCIDQLKNVYKYRKKIIQNELILFEKSRKNISNNSANLCTIDLQVDVNKSLEESSSTDHHSISIASATDTTDDDSHLNESNVTIHEEFDSGIDKHEKDNIWVSGKNNSDQKKNEQNSLKVERVKQDLKVDYKKNYELKTAQGEIEDDSVNDLLRDQCDMKLNNSDATKKDIQDFTGDKNSGKLNQNSMSIIQQNDTSLDMIDKENIEINNGFTINGKTSILNDQIDADVNLRQDKFNTFNMNTKFMCLTCLKEFESQKQLSVHYKTVELPKVVKEDPNIVKASNNNVGKPVFNCGVCSKVFDNRASVLRHTQIHKVERPFQCNLCSRTYKTVADILRHGVVHNDCKFVCSHDCGYATVHLGALREHVKRHNKDFKYKCEECGKCFQVKTWYDQHKNVHDRVRPFVCALCGQAFSMARYLTAHQANVHPHSSKIKRYKCVHCSLPCDSRKSLITHMKQKHGLKTDCLCDVCGQILPDKQKLIVHKSVHQATRKFSCRFCKKTFSKKDHKTVHEKIHTGDRLNCNSCPKSFTQRCSLRRHIKRYHLDDQISIEQKTS